LSIQNDIEEHLKEELAARDDRITDILRQQAQAVQALQEQIQDLARAISKPKPTRGDGNLSSGGDLQAFMAGQNSSAQVYQQMFAQSMEAVREAQRAYMEGMKTALDFRRAVREEVLEDCPEERDSLDLGDVLGQANQIAEGIKQLRSVQGGGGGSGGTLPNPAGT